MSDLREQIAQAITDCENRYDGKMDLHYERADAVLRVVKTALLSSQAGELMLSKLCQSDAFEVTATDLRDCLDAAWSSITEGGTDEP